MIKFLSALLVILSLFTIISMLIFKVSFDLWSSVLATAAIMWVGLIMFIDGVKGDK